MDNSNNNMSELDKITLECLMNESSYEKYLTNNTINAENDKINNDNDRRFYKKRIINMTKELLKRNSNIDTNTNIRNCFDEYVKNCVLYFKEIDRTDILQEKHGIKSVNTKDQTIFKENHKIHTILEENDNSIDHLLFNKNEKVKKITDLMGVKRKQLVKKKEVPIPKQYNINLKDPKLRKKGLKKKEKK